MIPNFKAVHNLFRINGYHYTHEGLKDVAYSFIKEGEPYEKELANFLLDWLDSEPTLKVLTSGSTGKPKIITLNKQSMVHSAIVTGNYFNLKPGDLALLCLPANYIAGKMMLVRAIILGLQLDIVTPSANPLAFLNKVYDFSAMVPMQLANSIDELSRVKTLIVGGAKVSQKLCRQISDSSSNIYITYGMTETITHIAVKKLSGNSLSTNFETLSDITISQDDRNCLIINAPYLSKEVIITNDVVSIKSDSSFELLGRIDNVINSGGVKIYPEILEEKLTSFIENDFFIASINDEVLGERVVLIIEGNEMKLPDNIFESLSHFEKPKNIFFTHEFERTPSGKLSRLKTLESIKR